MQQTLRRFIAACALGAATFATTIAADAASLRIENDTDKTIALLYVSPAWATIFRDRDQRLRADQYIRPGETWSIEFPGGDDCVFDLRAVFTDYSHVEHDDANLCTGDTWVIGD